MTLHRRVTPEFNESWTSPGYMNPWLTSKQIETKGTDVTVIALLRRTLGAARQVERLLDELEQTVGTVLFPRVWSYIRTQMSLQERLIAEQIFWDRGGRWRNYVTGFKPARGTMEAASPDVEPMGTHKKEPNPYWTAEARKESELKPVEDPLARRKRQMWQKLRNR